MTRLVVRGSEAAHCLMSAKPCWVEALPWYVAPGMWPPAKSVRKPTYTIVGRESAFADASSRARSAGCTSCVVGKVSEWVSLPVWPCTQGDAPPQTISAPNAQHVTNRRTKPNPFGKSTKAPSVPRISRLLTTRRRRAQHECYSTARLQRQGGQTAWWIGGGLCRRAPDWAWVRLCFPECSGRRRRRKAR